MNIQDQLKGIREYETSRLRADRLQKEIYNTILDHINSKINPRFSIEKFNKGKDDLRPLIKRHGTNLVLKSIDVSAEQYLRYEDGELTYKSAEMFFSKIGGIVVNKSRGIDFNPEEAIPESTEATDSNYQLSISQHELIMMATAATRNKIVNGEDTSVFTALGGNAIVLYINLRGRMDHTSSGLSKYLVSASHEELAADLGWVLEDAPQRITNAVRPLIQAGFITRYIPEDKTEKAKEVRKLTGNKYTNTYEIHLARICELT